MGAAGVSMYSKSSDVSDTACDIPIDSEVEKLVLPAQLTRNIFSKLIISSTKVNSLACKSWLGGQLRASRRRQG